MADSIEGKIQLPEMSDAQYRDCCLPGEILRPIDYATGECEQPFHRKITVLSPLNGIGFKVQGYWSSQPERVGSASQNRRLGGYIISINIPSTTVGNNFLLRNGVPVACELAILMLKIWLLNEGATMWVVQQLNFEDLELTSVTSTFLHRFKTPQLAAKARAALLAAMEIRNVPKVIGGKRIKQSKRAYATGDSESATAYLKSRNHQIVGYIKDPFAESVARFKNSEYEREVSSEATHYLRVENSVTGAWLKKNKLNRPDGWRLYGNETAYEKVYAEIRRDLRLGEKLRSKEPTLKEAKKLSKVDQAVLESHLEGKIARLHPLIRAERSDLQQQKYFSDMKQRLLERLQIDLSVPWKLQKKAFSANLSRVLKYPGMYTPPPSLEKVVFGEFTVNLARLELQQILSKHLSISISNRAVPRIPKEDRLVELGQLHVNEEDRTYLAENKRYLHELLYCHTLGIFGDVSLKETESLVEAARLHMPVTSRYNVRDKTFLICTEYSPKKSGASVPTTYVSSLDRATPKLQ